MEERIEELGSKEIILFKFNDVWLTPVKFKVHPLDIYITVVSRYSTQLFNRKLRKIEVKGLKENGFQYLLRIEDLI